MVGEVFPLRAKVAKVYKVLMAATNMRQSRARYCFIANYKRYWSSDFKRTARNDDIWRKSRKHVQLPEHPALRQNIARIANAVQCHN